MFTILVSGYGSVHMYHVERDHAKFMAFDLIFFLKWEMTDGKIAEIADVTNVKQAGNGKNNAFDWK